jgi:hypothetical protein
MCLYVLHPNDSTNGSNKCGHIFLSCCANFKFDEVKVQLHHYPEVVTRFNQNPNIIGQTEKYRNIGVKYSMDI